MSVGDSRAIQSIVTEMATHRADESAQLPEHLVVLGGQQWALWKSVCVRGAGFPATEVLKISSPAIAASADRLLQAEEEAEAAHGAALEAVNKSLDALRQNSRWDDSSERGALLETLHFLKANKITTRVTPGLRSQPVLAELLKAAARAEASRQGFSEVFEKSLGDLSKAIRALATGDRLREAVTWQNRGAVHTCISPLIEKSIDGIGRGSKQRQREELIASYVQRYCVKNDTIGFFGPVGWAEIVSSDKTIAARPGLSLLAKRNLYFEVWCIEALAEMLNKDKDLYPWLAPRRMHFLHVDGETVHFPGIYHLNLAPQESTVIRLCDGVTTAKEVAEAVVTGYPEKFKSTEAVYGLLESMRDRGLISWGIKTPIELHPERTIRRLLERVEDAEVRTRSLSILDSVEASRNAVELAAGDPEKLSAALDNLESTFTRLTGVASARAAGETYAGRTLVYEDCRRSIEIEIGSEFLNHLSKPLSLLLTSARWFTYRTAEIYNEAFKNIFADLAAKTGDSTIDFLSLWYKAQSIVFTENGHLLNPLVEDYRKRWESILRVPLEQRAVVYSCEILKSRVGKVFDAPHSGWTLARYHSPDVMIAASGIESISRGVYDIVLGELHMGINSLTSWLFMAQHPSPDEFARAIDLDSSVPRVVPVITKPYWPNQSSRLLFEPVSSKDFRLELSPSAIQIPRSQALPIGSLIVKMDGERLVVCTRDGRLSFDILEVFAYFLSLLVSVQFKLLRPASHTPRIYFDRMVVARETWQIPASELKFAFEKSESHRFVEARRWARSHDLPRFVFVKAPVEVKPFYVDFDSPVYINIFAKVVRRTTQLREGNQAILISEMLPDVNHVWLEDAESHRYTSELRIAALDLKGVN